MIPMQYLNKHTSQNNIWKIWNTVTQVFAPNTKAYSYRVVKYDLGQIRTLSILQGVVAR